MNDHAPDNSPVFIDDAPANPASVAEQARPAWELYQKAFDATVIADLITDLLHLADVTERPGGGERAMQLAMTEYLGDRARYLQYLAEAVAAPKAPMYLGQFQPEGQDWITIVEGEETVEPIDVAGHLRIQMQKAGLHTGELQAHVEDLARGAVLVADNGTAFRVITNPEYRA